MQLPIYEIADDFRAAITSGEKPRVLLKAPTGSGKSTTIPGLVADALPAGIVLVIEPRRMAARLLATWVASQRGTPVGEGVGYAVRFDTRYSRQTRIIYLTDGVFQRWIQDDPELGGVAAVVFDEFHERRLAVDIALSRCLDLQDGPRPDLRVVVMSATLETAGLGEFLAPVTTLEAGGRTYPVEVLHRAEKPTTHSRSGPPREVPVWEKVTRVCLEAMTMPEPGNILIFLPGTHEIRKTIDLLTTGSTTRGWDVFPLYSALPPKAQEQAIQPGPRPKIIVATNVAETSLTIEGVRTVIDSGLARIASYEARRSINTLHICKISRAAAEQRAGRAGRTAPGRAFRLWSQADHARRAEFESPEVHRVDLAEAVLLLKAAGVSDVRAFRWFTPPEEESLVRAETLLHDLGALDLAGNLTEEGAQMASMPLEPRFSRLLLAGHEHGCVGEMAFIAAAVQGEGVFSSKRGGISRKDFIHPHDCTDFAAEWRACQTAADFGFDPARCAPLSIHARGARETMQGYDRLCQMAQRLGWDVGKTDFDRRAPESIGKAMLGSFSDQLAIRFNEGTLACRLVHKRRGKLDEDSCAKNAPAFVASEITEVEAREVITHLRRATAIDPAWLAEIFPEDLHASDGCAWDESRRRVVARKETRFRDLVLESRDSDHGVNPDLAAQLLAQHVIDDELVLKKWDHSVEQWAARLSLLSTHMPELEMPTWSDADRADAIAQICHGSVAYKDIKDADPWPVLNDWLSAAQKSALDAYCPTRITLANGQSAKITYEIGKDPFIALRYRDLFGQKETPAIVQGRVPLLVHILTPAQRPWQITKDLKTFWASGYPQMKKELAGRYPKHPWPDQP